jgi:hypothetical protein
VRAGDRVYNTQPQQYNIHHHSPTKSKYTNQIKIYQPNQSKKSTNTTIPIKRSWKKNQNAKIMTKRKKKKKRDLRGLGGGEAREI